MTNIVLHPELAKIIASAVNDRAVAAGMVYDILRGDCHKSGDYEFWRNMHVAATKRLAEFGIVLSTYGLDANDKEQTT